MKVIFTLTALLFIACANAQQSQRTTDIYAGDSVKILIQAKFPGGIDAWTKYLQANLHNEVAANNIRLRRHQKDSAEMVIVSFLVDKEGNITDVKVENPEVVNDIVGNEAMRVIRNGPKWIPAVQNERPVIFRQRQAITFVVSK